jgi:formamidopyrimidine-DNA glycosylase
MPELPEVETTRRGIEPHISGRTVREVVVRERRLRWPVSPRWARALPGTVIRSVDRRAKYLLIRSDTGTTLLHLGMSGSLRLVTRNIAPRKHDHIDIVFDAGCVLRFHDPRRFGSIHWTTRDPLQHRLLRDLGPEPLSDTFDASHLWEESRGRRVAVKSFIMDSHIVVGVGNIYASEALFRARIHPNRAAGRVSEARYAVLVETIRDVLSEAIKDGGTTLRDFVGEQGQPGYFVQQLRVYDREGEPCLRCGTPVKAARIGQRSAFYCPACQH